MQTKKQRLASLAGTALVNVRWQGKTAAERRAATAKARRVFREMRGLRVKPEPETATG